MFCKAKLSRQLETRLQPLNPQVRPDRPSFVQYENRLYPALLGQNALKPRCCVRHEDTEGLRAVDGREIKNNQTVASGHEN